MTDKPRVWPTLRYEDPKAAMQFLSDALGFVKVVAYEDGDGNVEHAQMNWPGGGGIMLGKAREEGVLAGLPAGMGAVYLVASNPDELFARATGAGAHVVMGLADQDYGSRDFTIRDPEGIYWSIGTYEGD